MSEPLRIALLGASGRMGQALAALIEADASLAISGRWQRGDGDPAAALEGAQVAVDFTTPEALGQVVAALRAAGVPLVSGTTGLGDAVLAALDDLARSVPVLVDGNMSLGIHVTAHLAAEAARLLPGYDIEISETHHRGKRDAPSGTALKLGNAVASVRGTTAPPMIRLGADAPRQPGDIGYAVRRGGGVIGEHTVALFGDHDRVEIHHAAADRDLFAEGALAAARWLVGQPAGRYSMASLFVTG